MGLKAKKHAPHNTHSSKHSWQYSRADYLQKGRLGAAVGVGGRGVDHAAAAAAAAAVAAAPAGPAVGVQDAAACYVHQSPELQHEGHTWL